MNSLKGRIGIFGGTFDPIHFGHLNLALQMLEYHQLESIWFIPARVSPHKLDKRTESEAHRLKMLELALQDQPAFKIKDIEIHRPGPSYTIETLRYLIKNEPDKQFALILGDDALQHFLYWSEPEEIIQLVPLLIGLRDDKSLPDEWKNLPWLMRAVDQGLTPTRRMEISSTELRKRLADEKYCGYLMPKKVLDYIREHKLYLNSL